MAPRRSREQRRPILTPSESEIMQVLWSRDAGLTVHEVLEALPRSIAYTTVLTTLRILERKGYVHHRPHQDGGRAHLYAPTEPADKTRLTHTRDLIDRLFAGKPRELLVGLLQEEPLAAEELQELKALVDAKLDAQRMKGKRR